MSSEHKQFSLKPIEVQLLSTIMQTHQTQMANLLSYISLERLARQATPNTMFNLDLENGTLEVWDEEPPTPLESDTAKALKREP